MSEIDWIKRRDRRLQEIDYHEAKLQEGIRGSDSPLYSLEQALAIAEAKAERLERVYSQQLLSERKQHRWELNQLKEENRKLKETLNNLLDEKDKQIIMFNERGMTIRDIACQLGMSPSTVHYRIKKLIEKGLL